MKIRKNTLFILSLTAISLLPKEAAFVIAVLYLLYKIGYTTGTWKPLGSIFLLFLIGMLAGYTNPKIDVLRDIFIISKIVVYFWIGVILATKAKGWNVFFKYLKLIALASAIYHISAYIRNDSTGSTIDQLRQKAGLQSYVEAIAVGIILAQYFNKRFRVLFYRRTKLLSFTSAILLTSFVLYYSRTMIITALVVVLFLCNWINIRQFRAKANGRLLMVSTMIIVLLYAVNYFAPADSVFGQLVTKFKDSPDEIFWDKNKNRQSTWRDINLNWRGYESYRGILKYISGSDIEKYLGFGMGSRVDLGLTISLGGTEMSSIPVMHNGYVMLLVKTGAIGVLLYLLFLYRLGFRRIRNGNFYALQLLSALALTTFINTFTVAGLMSEADIVTPTLLGMFWKLSTMQL